MNSIIHECASKTNKSPKFNLQYYFMSHYVYRRQTYDKEAAKLSATIKIKKPNLNQYESKDKIVYLQHLWETITANDGEIDLRI